MKTSNESSDHFNLDPPSYRELTKMKKKSGAYGDQID